MAPTSSGSAWSERAVNPTRSQNNTVTTLRSSSVGRGAAASGAPHAPQNRKPWGLSCPHLEQLAIAAVYGEAREPQGCLNHRLPRVNGTVNRSGVNDGAPRPGAWAQCHTQMPSR
jgi:hypothetical protein